ncbi:T9SS type A sorting domain-containing protein [candidate division KSB1 bacterium]
MVLKRLTYVLAFLAVFSGFATAQSTNITATIPADSSIGATTSFTVVFNTATTLNNIGDEIVITFPAVIDVSGISLNGAGTVMVSGTDPSINGVESSGQTIVLDIGASESSGSHTIVFDGIVNPGTPQDNISVDVSTRLNDDTPVDSDDGTPAVFHIVGKLTLGASDSPITSNALTLLEGTGGSDIELTSFKLTAVAEDFDIDTIRVTPTFTGMTNAEISTIDIFEDTNGNGVIDGLEASITQSTVDEQGSGNSVPVPINYTLSTGSMNFIVVATLAASVGGSDQLTIDIDAASNISGSGGSISGGTPWTSGGSISGNTHTVTGNLDITGITLQAPGINDTGMVTIEFDTKTSLTAGTDEIVITFPGNFDLSNVDISSATSILGGAVPTINAGETAGQVVTLTANGTVTPGTQTVVLKDVINPPTVQNGISVDVITQASNNTQIDGDDAAPVSFDVVGLVQLEIADVPIDTNVLKKSLGTGGTNLVITTFKITGSGENAPINSLSVTPYFGGMTAGEISNINIYEDLNNDGILDGGESQITTGAVDDNGSGNQVVLPLNAFTQNIGSDNFLVTVDIAGTITLDDSIRIDVDSTAAWSFGLGSVTGSTIRGNRAHITGHNHSVTDTLNLKQVGLSNTGILSTGLDTLIIETQSHLDPGDEIVVTYPAGFDAAAATVDGGTSISVTKNATDSDALNVVLTAQVFVPASEFTIILNNITNPNTIQNDIYPTVYTRTNTDDLIDAVDTTPDTLDVTATLTLGAAVTAIDTNILKQRHLAGSADTVMTTFRLTAAGENVPVTSINVTPNFSGMTTGEITSMNIYSDGNSDGKVNGGDAPVTSGSFDNPTSGTAVTFTTPGLVQNVGSSDFIVVATVSSAVTASDRIRIDISQAADIVVSPGPVTGKAERIGTAITGWWHTVTDSLDLTGVGLSNPGVSRTSTDTIKFTTMTRLQTTDRIIIQFPAGFDASGASVNGATTVPSGGLSLVSAAATTVTVQTTGIVNSGSIKLVLNSIVNPGTVQDEINLTVHSETAAGDLIDRADTTPAAFDVVATLTLEAATVTIDTNVLKLKHNLDVTNAVFTTFKLTAAGENVPITQLSVTPVFRGIAAGQLSNIGIYLDDGSGGGTADDGLINGGETFVGGSGFQDDNDTDNSVNFAVAYTQNSGTNSNFMVLATLDNTISVNDTFRMDIDQALDFQLGVGPVTGSPAELIGPVLTGFQHIVTDSADIDLISNSNTGVGQTSSYTVSLNSTTNLAAGDEIVVEFPAGFDASGFTVNAGTTTPSTVLPAKNTGETNATTAVLDASAFEPAGNFTLILDNIINPATVQNDITLNVYTQTDGNDLIDEVDTSRPTFDIGATIRVETADSPIDTNNLKQVESYGVTTRELTTFKLTTAGENVPVTSIKLTPYFNRITPAEISNFDVYLDNGAGGGGIADDGIVNGTESSITSGAVDDAGSGNTITLTIPAYTQTPGSANLIIVADLANTVTSNDSIQVDVDAASTFAVGNGPVTDIPAEPLGAGITGFKHYVTDTVSVSSVALQYPGISQVSRYDVTFHTKADLKSGNEEIVMIFPAGFNPQTAAINNANTVTVSGVDPVISGGAGQTLIFTIQAKEDSGKQIISLDNITNPGTVQNDKEIKVYTRTAVDELIDASAGIDAYFDVVGTLTLAAADAPIDTNQLKQAENNGYTTRELTAFKLTAAGETINISSIQVTPVYIGMTSGQITNIDIYQDDNGNGVIDGAEATVAASTVNAGASGNALTVNLLPVNLAVGQQNYIISADIASGVSANDQLRVNVNAAADYTLGPGGTTGSAGQAFGTAITGFTHTVTDSVYVSATSAAVPEISSESQYTLTFTTSTDLASGDSLLVTFPAVLNIASATLNNTTTSPSGTDPTLSAVKNQTIHFKTNAGENAGAFSLVIDGIVNSGTVQNDISVSVETKNASNEFVDRAEDTPSTFDVVGKVTLEAAPAPVDSNRLAFTEGIGGTKKVMTAFRLSAEGESFTIDQLSVTPVFTGMVTAEVFDIDLYLDNGAGGGVASNGKLDGTEGVVSVATAAVNDGGSGNPVAVALNSHTLAVGSQDYLLTATFTNAVSANDDIRFDINDSTFIVSSGGATTGSSAVEHGDDLTGYTHIVTGNLNIERIIQEKSGFDKYGKYTINFTTKTDLDNVGDEFVFTFPTGFDLANVGVDPATVTQSGTDPVLDAGETSGLTVVLNIQAAESAGLHSIVLSGIHNPNTLQDDISLNVSTRLDNNDPVDGEDSTPETFDITGTIAVADGDAVISINALGSLAEIGGTDIPLTTFKLSAEQENFTIDSIKVLPVFKRLDAAELSAINIYLDNGDGGGTAGNGEIDGTEAPITISSVNDNGDSTPVKLITTGHTISAGSSNNYIIVASLASSIEPDDSLRIDIDSTFVFGSGGSVTGGNACISGKVQGLTHMVDTRFNINSITLSHQGFGETTDMFIQLRTIISLPSPGDEIVITFPDTLDISGITLSQATETPSGSLPEIDDVKSSGQQIVLNVTQAEPGGIFNLVFSNILNPGNIAKDLTCIIYTRQDNGTILADEDETPATFAVTGKVVLDKGPIPITTNNLEDIARTGGSRIPLTAFSLKVLGEAASIDTVWIRPVFPTLSRKTVSGFNIYLDDGAGVDGVAGNGRIESEEEFVAVSPVDEQGSGVAIPIALTGQNLALNEKRNYIIAANFTSRFSAQNTIEVDIDSARTSIYGVGEYTNEQIEGTGGGISGYRHRIPGLKLPELNDTTITEAQKLVLNLAGPFTDVPGRKFEVDNLPEGAELDDETGLFTWTPNLDQASEYPYTFRVAAEGSSDEATIQVIVLDIDPLTDLVHADTTGFRPGFIDTIQAKFTGIYTLHSAASTLNSVTRNRTIIVRQPSVQYFSLNEILDHPSTVEFVVEGYEDEYIFSDSVSITVEYKDFEVNDNEENMRIFYWDTDGQFWNQVPGTQWVETDSNTVTVKTTHFTIYSAQELVDSTYSTTLSGGWNMVGIPIEPSGGVSVYEQLSDDLLYFIMEDRNSSIYSYNTDSLKWIVPDEIARGTGYIIWNFEKDTRFDIDGLEALSDVTHTLQSENKWALVGNPFNQSINWDSQVARTNIANIFYYWDGRQYRFYPDGGHTNTIQPWQAVFIKSEAASAQITFQYSGPEITAKRSNEIPVYQWRTQIKASIYTENYVQDQYGREPAAIDHYNYFGRSASTNISPSLLRNEELEPLTEKYVSLFFTRELHDGIRHLTQDITSDSLDCYTWDMELKSNISTGTAVLEWSVPEQFPENWDLLLINESTENSINMLDKTSYAYTLKTGKQSVNDQAGTTDIVKSYWFKIVAQKKTETAPSLPQHYYIEQNYPNPFNAETTIRYGLPEAARVTIKIYSITGQHITTLINDARLPGHYSITWNGTNDLGNTVSSGVYFYSIRANDFTSSKKLIIVK